MLKIFLFCLLFSIKSFAQNLPNELNKPFGEWLVSCKQNLMTAKNECFIGSPFKNEQGRGAIVFTKYYLAVAHNDLNLTRGVNFKVDRQKEVSSYMNTGLNVFFKNSDRQTLITQMSKGRELSIIIKGITEIDKSLEGFAEAYKFYIKQIEG
ncbi:MAG: hypothetical protein HON42_00290 [Alphaproteobacteria bacterium]|jgi:invasion protein IalB|nr:hypothetical protein [Alphaproteobacteria bacterium]MBT5828341.1 hypothetical protein [Alphaproteobacteria bacterium]